MENKTEMETIIEILKTIESWVTIIGLYVLGKIIIAVIKLFALQEIFQGLKVLIN